MGGMGYCSMRMSVLWGVSVRSPMTSTICCRSEGTERAATYDGLSIVAMVGERKSGHANLRGG